MRLRANTIAALAAALLGGCTPSDEPPWLHDAGILAAQRYRFDFGVPQAEKTHTFHFRAPSGDEFCFGLEGENRNPQAMTHIRVTMALARGEETVFSISQPLSQWAVTKTQGKDDFFFHPCYSTAAKLKRWRSYRLTFTMHNASPAPLRLTAYGGGWK